MTLTVLIFLLQACGCSRRGFHSHQTPAGRGTAESSRRDDGPPRSSPGNLPLHGKSSAEVPSHHPPAAVPQHGEHLATLVLLHHQQHDTKGKAFSNAAAGGREKGMARLCVQAEQKVVTGGE